MGSDLAAFFVNLPPYYYASMWIKDLWKKNLIKARK